MNIVNLLPHFVEGVKSWEHLPTPADLLDRYLRPGSPQLDLIFGLDGESVVADLREMDWASYRNKILTLDPLREESRLRRHLADVEALFGYNLEGEAVLFSAFHGMDGYARFEYGKHRIFLAVDERFNDGAYIDVLMVHELTHAARESRPEIWSGWGLNVNMSNHEFTENQPVIEHLIGEGLSCAVSERLVPGASPWLYCYQDQAGFEKVIRNAARVDEVIKQEILHPQGDYGRLYQSHRYGRGMPGLVQYVWAWKWAEAVVRDFAGGNPAQMVNVCSKEWIEHALDFSLARVAQAEGWV